MLHLSRFQSVACQILQTVTGKVQFIMDQFQIVVGQIKIVKRRI